MQLPYVPVGFGRCQCQIFYLSPGWVARWQEHTIALPTEPSPHFWHDAIETWRRWMNFGDVNKFFKLVLRNNTEKKMVIVC